MQNTSGTQLRRSECLMARARRHATAARRGMTIVEVMVAAAIMALVISTSITVMQRAFLSLDTARNITIAGQIMQSEFEKMRMNDWSTISKLTAGQSSLTVDPVFTTHSFIGTRFRLTQNVVEISTAPGASMRQITLTCSWTSYDGRSMSRSYTTFYGQNGLYDYFYNSL